LKKALKVIIIVCIFIALSFGLLLGLISGSSKIKNPFIGLDAIIMIEKSNDLAEMVSEKPLRYITRNQDDFKKYMEKEGYSLVDQTGRGFYFKKGSETIVLGMEGFMKYSLFKEDF
jgi:hypothetical protein